MMSKNKVIRVIFFIICAIEINAKPSFNLSAIGSFVKGSNKTLKPYSGKRVQFDSIRMVYFNEFTLAIIELGPNKLLLNCELVELFEPDDIFRTLGELRDITKPVDITFDEMLALMSQCKELEDMKYFSTELLKNNTSRSSQSKGLLANNPFSLLNGIVPGTKWCGTGDIAKDYFDLGSETFADACCRAHDLCPIKVRAYSQKYNLTNNSLYTKSHCKCDDNFYKCLKHNKSQTSNIMGNIYFNLVQVPCVEDSTTGRTFRSAKHIF